MPDLTPTFSIITPVYNGAAYLPDLIDSVQQQSFTDYEHIIIDDGSTDDGATIAVLERYAADDARIRWWTRENQGQYATQNEGIARACGDYVVCIAADDVVAIPDALEIVAQSITEVMPADVIYGTTGRMDEQGGALPNIELSWRPSRWLIKSFVYVQHCSLYARRAFLVEKELMFDPAYRYAGDWDWLVRVFDNAHNIRYVRQRLSIIRMHDNQTSRTATRVQIDAEHRRVARTYGGYYGLHVVLTWINNRRAMVLIGLDILRRRGLRAFFARIRAWLRKRFNR